MNDIDEIRVQIAAVEPLIVQVQAVEKVIPKNEKTPVCEQEIPDLVLFYQLAKL